MRFVFTLVILCFSAVAMATEQAKQLFAEYAPALYQIRLIENASGEKSSIGSGFQISPSGVISTNYHVISGFAQHPEKYQLEYLDHNGEKGYLSLLSVDVVNDLALVKREVTEQMSFFPIATEVPIKGDEIFSLGNPHDLGMIVVPGTYNGIKSDSFNERIHFTGSVNSGMSGGPVVNNKGEVVGVNVATSGNQIGFLVPQDKLSQLVQQYTANGGSPIDLQIASQLKNNQSRLLTTLLNSPWQLKTLGKGAIPNIDVPFMRCWGDSNADKVDDVVFTAVSSCTLDEDIFISDKFYSGSFDMQFRWIESRKLNELRFYHLYKKQISNAAMDNKVTKQDVTEFECQHNTVKTDMDNMKSRAILCTRAYKKYSGLYDVMFLSASIDRNTEALISHFTLSGVNKDLSLRFTQKFMENVQWN